MIIHPSWHPPETPLWPIYFRDPALVPKDPRTFFGRADPLAILDAHFIDSLLARTDIHPALLPAANGQKRICLNLHGRKGAGKTQMAVRWSEMRKGAFDAVMVVSAVSEGVLLRQFHEIALLLNLNDGKGKLYRARETSDTKANTTRVLEWLASPKFSDAAFDLRAEVLRAMPPREPNWLIVFDNVADPDVLIPFWPAGGGGSVLMTTRSELPFHPHTQTQWMNMCLNGLETATSADFLMQITHTEENPVNRMAAEAVADKMQGLPGAIRALAEYIRHKQISLQQYEREYAFDWAAYEDRAS